MVMQKPEIIVVPQISLSEDEVLITDLGQSISLYPDHLIIKCRGKWQVNDGVMVKEQEYDDMLFVHDWCGLGMDLSDTGLYVIFIDSWRFYFKEKSEARKLFDRIHNWKCHTI